MAVNVLVIDCETWRSQKFAFGVVYDTNTGEHYVCMDIEEMRDRILSYVRMSRNAKKIFILGHNIGYDLNWIFGNYELFFVPEYTVDSTRKTKNGDPVKRYWKDCITRKGKFYKATFYNLIFMDTFNLFPMSLEKAGKVVGLEKPIEMRKKFETQSSGGITAADIEYCKNDCDITYKLYQRLLKYCEDKGAKLGLTMASTAKNILFTMNPDFKFYIENFFRRPYMADLDEQFRSAYFGGRTECFRKSGKDLNYYDINSLYPYCMSDDRFMYPDPSTLRKFGGDLQYALDNFEGMATITVNVPRSITIPVLPVRVGKNPKIPENKIIYPTGQFTGSYAFPEIRKALEMGCTITKAHRIIIGNRIPSPWKDYCRTLYDERLAQKKNKDPTEQITKLYLNAAYGKFGMRNFEDHYITVAEAQEKFPTALYEIVESEGQEYAKVSTEPERSRISIVSIVSYVTSHARTVIYDVYRAAGFDVYYSDTDSLVTKADLPIGEKMGDLKLEHSIEYGSFKGRKDYLLITGDQAIIKRKGIPFNFMTKCGDEMVSSEFKRLFKDGDIDLLTKLHNENRITVEKIVKSREAIRRGLRASGTVIMEKERKTLFDTGKKWEGDYSYPFDVQENEGKDLSIC